MKLLAAVLTLSASLSLGHAANFCAVPAPKSCADLPQSSADACSSLIAKSNLELTTYTNAKSTVTSTSTVQPSVTETVTVTQTVSSTAAFTLALTSVTTATSTTTSITTLVQTSTSTFQTTAVVPITATTTETSTVTSVATTTVPFPQQTCTTAPAMRRRQPSYPVLDSVPRDCSCYLTTTATYGGTTATVWTTVTEPTLTISVTQSEVTTIVNPETKTTDALQTTTTVTAEISTETSVSTIDITETITATTVVATATIVTTQTAKSTQTVTSDPCADPTLYTATRPDYPGSAWGVISDSWSAKGCCSSCYYSNAGCLFWKFQDNTCTQYVIPNKMAAVGCTTSICRRGIPQLVSSPGDGATYGVGICAAPGFSG